ncbi:MAG: FtsQ-type POTRA domain-containing protein [Microbacteriaceae bacterium]|nr:FtsQ-type POTRA domain-containing protein [Burkholderiaceae bacterium]
MVRDHALQPTYGLPAGLPADVRLMQATANAVFVLVALAACVAAALWAARLPVFAVKVIRIEGEVNRNSESTIRANTVHRLVGSFLTLDLQKSRAAFEAVPWVRQAVVRREWPMRLAVRLEEHRPLALWAAADGNDRLVNSHGEVFETNIGDVEDGCLPSLAGPEGSAPQMLALLGALGPVLAPLNAGGIDRLALSARGSWRATMEKSAVIELGRGSAAEVIARAQRFVATMPRVEAQYRRRLESADLRHAEGFAVRLQGVTTTVPAPPVRKK